MSSSFLSLAVLLGLCVATNADFTDCRSDFSREYDRFHRIVKCVPFEEAYNNCSRFGYVSTRMPNLLNHQAQDEAQAQLNAYSRFVECHPEMLFLLCLYHFPICMNSMTDRPVVPCRGLCQRVRSECEPTMEEHGKQWPRSLNCSVLPVTTESCEYELGKTHLEVCHNNASVLKRLAVPSAPKEPGDKSHQYIRSSGANQQNQEAANCSVRVTTCKFFARPTMLVFVQCKILFLYFTSMSMHGKELPYFVKFSLPPIFNNRCSY